VQVSTDEGFTNASLELQDEVGARESQRSTGAMFTWFFFKLGSHQFLPLYTTTMLTWLYAANGFIAYQDALLKSLTMQQLGFSRFAQLGFIFIPFNPPSLFLDTSSVKHK